MEQSRVSIERDFRSIIAKQLGLEADRLPGTAKLSALGLDLAGLLGLIYAVERHFDVQTSNKPLSEEFTLDESICWLETVIKTGGRAMSETVMAEGAD